MRAKGITVGGNITRQNVQDRNIHCEIPDVQKWFVTSAVIVTSWVLIFYISSEMHMPEYCKTFLILAKFHGFFI